MFKCLIPFRTTLGCSFRLLLSFPTLRIGKGLNFVLYEPSFQTLIKCFAFNLTHKRISRLLHMFFKELCMFAYCLVINVHLLFAVRSRVSFVRLSRPANFVNNFFYFFQNIFSNVFRRYFERRKRDLNPRAAINDLLPFQGSPFSLLGISPFF